MIPTDEQIDRWYAKANDERYDVQQGITETKYTTVHKPEDRPARRAQIETIISLYLTEGGLDENDREWIKATDLLPTEQDADCEEFLITFGNRGLIFTTYQNVRNNPKTYTHWMKTPAPPTK